MNYAKRAWHGMSWDVSWKRWLGMSPGDGYQRFKDRKVLKNQHALRE